MKKVESLAHLYRLAEEKKSIVLAANLTTLVQPPKGWVGHQGRTPAAWAINWTGQMIHRLLPYMYVHEPKEKPRASRTAKDVERSTAESPKKE